MAWWGNMPVIHGMQEVWGSNPHSSTDQKRKSNVRAASTAAKYSNATAVTVRTRIRSGLTCGPGAAGMVLGFSALGATFNLLTRQKCSFLTCETT